MLPRSKGLTLYAYAHTHYTCIQIGLLLTRVLVDLCRCRPRIVAAQKLDLEIKSRRGKISKKYSIYTIFSKLVLDAW